MAIHAHSTPAPVDHRALLRTRGAPCRILGKYDSVSLLPPSIFGAVPVPTPALTAETVTLLDAIPPELPLAQLSSLVAPGLRRRHLNESQRAMAAAKLANMKEGYAASQRQPHEMIAENDGVEISTPCISQGEAANLLNVSRSTVTEAKKVLNEGTAGDVRHGGAGGVCATLAEIGGTRSEPPKSAGPGRAEEADAAAAQALHMRRALEGHSVIGDALDTAVGTLDALDAPDENLEEDGSAEPSLGWIDGKPVLSDSHDDREAEDDDEPILGAPERHPSCYQFALCDATSSQEHWADGSARYDEAEVVNEDGGDILDEGEETLGWAANVGQLALGQTTADGDATALERHGRGFLRSGPEDAEDDDPAGGQQPDEDALFWSIDVGCAIGAPLDVEGAHV